MSVEPPSSGRPSGPPSGPLSGPSEPPSVPPSQPPPPGPPSQPTGGGEAPEPGRPWWKSAPRVAVVSTAVVAAVVLAVVFSSSGGGSGSGGGEVFLQAAGKSGPDPFTPSTATDNTAPPVSPSATATESAPANAVRSVGGGTAGLYGGSQRVSSCDVEKQVKYMQAAPSKSKAFASVAGVDTAQVPSYLRSLTPVQLRMDTRVTNHGYNDGTATGYQAVLQTGTAVLVDGHGVPRVRCACGNPLTPPVAQQGTPKPKGDTWASYRSSNVVVVSPSVTVINVFVLYDHDHDHWFARHRGDTGGKDQKAKPPVKPTPSVTVTTPPTSSSPSSHSPSPCVSSPSGKPSPSTKPCPPTSTAPSSSPSSQSPSSSPPSSPSVPPPSVPPPSVPPPSVPPPSVPPSSVPPSSAPPSSVPGVSEAPGPSSLTAVP
ncbi:DUF6777 domain-containing protein [Streptomyces sp. HUAS ZL42]|uniref:DUF6777 domain-containing protein n=1 Tax=Streptomyces sp. HUAS ZL42 TaxID=3231715 RepID=UPI00345E18C2